MIRKDGLIKLMDFGIAQVLDFQRMTVTGQLLGSPAYMAPEIIEGKPLDFRTDVFSVGIMLYLLATGELPFAGKNPHEVLLRISEGRFADPRTVAHPVDQRAARIITRALARRPDDRYPGVAPMEDDLMAYLADAGLTDVRAELRGFFADPACYEKALPARMAAALSASAGKHLRERRVARAMELWNRVLAFDPQNAEVTAALDRLQGRRRLLRASIASRRGRACWRPAGGSWRSRARPRRRRPAVVERLSTPAAPAPPVTASDGALRTEAAPAGSQMSETPRPVRAHARSRARRAASARLGAAPARRSRRERSRWDRRPRTSTSTWTASASSLTTRRTPRSRSPGRPITCWSCEARAAVASSSASRLARTIRCRQTRSSPAA